VCTQQLSASDTPATVTTTTATTTTTTATSTTTTTTTTVAGGSGNDVSSSVESQDSGSSNGIGRAITQHGSADAPEIKVKLEKAKVHLTYHTTLKYVYMDLYIYACFSLS
jgi:hypothetical protein